MDYIVDALSSLGGRAHLDQITRRVLEIAPAPMPRSTDAIIRARIQERCSDTESYKGREDLFYSVYGVDARRGWWGLRRDVLSVSEADTFQDGADAFMDAEEGRAALRIHLRRERSSALVRAFKEGLPALTCAACDFDFETAYGEAGAGYIEAHHIVPVASLVDGARTRLQDLVALCANCHRVVHRNGLMDWRDLRDQLQARKRAERDVS